eukprot:scpid74294/ scgid15399/ Craniofacial development protein 2; p97 bucentaur protein
MLCSRLPSPFLVYTIESLKFSWTLTKNARVGSGHSQDSWCRVRGPHGLGILNSSGEHLLSFLAMHEGWICNTWFCKKAELKGTWMHPRSRHVHCIDYIIVARRDRHRCTDSQIIPSAECGSDHSLLAMRFRLGRVRWRKPAAHSKRARFATCRLPDIVSTDDNGQVRRVVDEYQDSIAARLRGAADPCSTVDEKWNNIRSAMTDAAQSALGRQGRRQPDWFADSRDTLKPLLVERNACHRSWITNGRRNDDYQKLRTARRQARQAVRTAKNQWFATVAGRVESGRFNSARVWAGIRSLQDARSGLKPIPSMAILDENGNICTSPAEQGQRWSRHFTKVYNIPSTFDSGVIDQVEQQDIVEELGEPPNLAELQRAVSAMSNGKAAGGSDILPEMVKAGGPALMCALLDLVCTVWEAEAVPQEW